MTLGQCCRYNKRAMRGSILTAQRGNILRQLYIKPLVLPPMKPFTSWGLLLFYTPSRRIAIAASTAAMTATATSRMKFMGISSFDREHFPRLERLVPHWHGNTQVSIEPLTCVRLIEWAFFPDADRKSHTLFSLRLPFPLYASARCITDREG